MGGPAPTKCDEKAVVRHYKARWPNKKICEHDGICVTRLYKILRKHKVKLVNQPQTRKKINRDKEQKRKCLKCGARFSPYIIDGQYCKYLCQYCWQENSRPGKQYACEVNDVGWGRKEDAGTRAEYR